VDLARHHLEVDAIKCRRRPEPFPDVPGAGRYIVHCNHVSSEVSERITPLQKRSISGTRSTANFIPRLC
jgi:hypothetical protein